jgi:hypothetical protein
LPEGKNRTDFWQKTAISLHRCVMIEIVFSDTMSDFAKFIPQKSVLYAGLNFNVHFLTGCASLSLVFGRDEN